MRWSTLVPRVAQPVAAMARTIPAIARTPAPYARIASGLAAGLRARGLVHLEGHRHAHPAGNRLAILERRLERPLLHRLQRDLVEHAGRLGLLHPRSEEHTPELHSLIRTS